MLKTKPDLSFWKLFNISFGFFGVQIAYALQSANISRIFATLGADPHDLSFFWILPPLMGMLVQPLVGYFSDKTWCRFGRRIPYLFVGAFVAVVVMCLLPNAGSFGLAVSGAMVFGLIALMFLDTSINMAMQPFKMMVGDLVNEKQKTKAYSIQSFLCNAGSIVEAVVKYHMTGHPDEVSKTFGDGKDFRQGCVGAEVKASLTCNSLATPSEAEYTILVNQVGVFTIRKADVLSYVNKAGRLPFNKACGKRVEWLSERFGLGE